MIDPDNFRNKHEGWSLQDEIAWTRFFIHQQHESIVFQTQRLNLLLFIEKERERKNQQ